MPGVKIQTGGRVWIPPVLHLARARNKKAYHNRQKQAGKVRATSMRGCRVLARGGNAIHRTASATVQPVNGPDPARRCPVESADKSVTRAHAVHSTQPHKTASARRWAGDRPVITSGDATRSWRMFRNKIKDEQIKPTCGPTQAPTSKGRRCLSYFKWCEVGRVRIAFQFQARLGVLYPYPPGRPATASPDGTCIARCSAQPADTVFLEALPAQSSCLSAQNSRTAFWGERRGGCGRARRCGSATPRPVGRGRRT